MSVQSEIERINNNVQSTLQTIADTGVEVGSNSDALPAAAAALANEKAPVDHTHTAQSIGPLPTIAMESTDGVAYTASVPWITALEPGARFLAIPNKLSTNIGPTLNVNGLGAKPIRCLTGYNTAGIYTGAFAGWISPDKPVDLLYNGLAWVAMGVQRTSAAAIMGTVGVDKGGTGADTAAGARANLGAVGLPVVDDAVNNGAAGQFAFSDGAGGINWGGMTYVESLDQENLVNLRDLESGNYILYGYFSPFANSHTSMSCDNNLVSVYRVDAGSHIFCFEPLNAKVVFIEILADDTVEAGHTYSRTIIPMLDLYDTFKTLPGQVGELSADKVSKTALTLGLYSDGKYYIFVDGAPVGTGFELSGGDVFGYVDENNNIVLNGSLADGTYSIKYEMEDGSTVEIGDLVLDSNVYYSITNNLTNCTNSNSAAEAIGGQSYSATISANDGYELSSVVVTMGGTDVSASAVSGGNISIAEVTGNIVITAVAEEVKAVTNFAEYNADNTSDWNLWINNARIGSDGTYRSDTEPADYGTPCVSPWIEVQNGDVIKYEGMYTSNKSTALYNTDKVLISASSLPANAGLIVTEECTVNTYAGQFTINNANAAYLRLGGYTYTNKFPDIIINIQRNGEWL